MTDDENLLKKHRSPGRGVRTTVYLHAEHPDLLLVWRMHSVMSVWEVRNIAKNSFVQTGADAREAVARAMGWAGTSWKGEFAREGISLRAVEGPRDVYWTAESGEVKEEGWSAKEVLTVLARSHDQLAGTALELANKACF